MSAIDRMPYPEEPFLQLSQVEERTLSSFIRSPIGEYRTGGALSTVCLYLSDKKAFVKISGVGDFYAKICNDTLC